MATPLGNSVPSSGNNLIDGLIQGSKWSGGNLTYSLWDTVDLGIWDQYSKNIIDYALSQYSNVANLSFSYLPNDKISPSGRTYKNDSSDLEFLLTGDLLGFSGLAVFPDTNFGNTLLSEFGLVRSQYPNVEGSVFLDSFRYPFQGVGALPGGYGFAIILHEIGHALGLKHPHDDGGNGRPRFDQLGISALDRAEYTIMSYEPSQGALVSLANPSTLMPLDILALQYIYGANMGYNAGDNIFTLPNDILVQTLWDAGGNDVIDATQLNKAVNINLEPGSFSYVGSTVVAIAYNSWIENVAGSSLSDVISGNMLSNNLLGGDGNDSLNGRTGNDVLNGNTGVDEVFGGQGNDDVQGGRDNDTVNGNLGNDTVNGNLGSDVVRGGQGEDIVRGGQGEDIIFGDFGNDSLFGDRGNDTLYGGAGIDVFYFSSDSGIDYIMDYGLTEDILYIQSNINNTGLTSKEQIFAAATQIQNDVHILLGSSTVVLQGINLSLLNADDFAMF